MKRRQSFATILLGKSALLREGLGRILRSENFRILTSVSCAADLLPGKLQLNQPLYLIVCTGEDFDGALEQIGILRDRHPGGRIAIVTDHYRLDELVSAFRAGANGYFADAMPCNAFIKAIELVMMGETILPPALLSLILDPDVGVREAVRPNGNSETTLTTKGGALSPQLSAREHAILSYLIEGESNKCIARKIDIAEATVKVHVKAILRKIRVQNRTQAAIWGMNNGSLTRLANNNSPPPACDVKKPFPNANEVTSEPRQIELPAPTEAINPQPNHVEVARIDRLIKDVNKRSPGTARGGK